MTDLALSDVPPVGRPPAALPWRHVAAVTAGNALEFYDFLTFSYFATYIGRTFFPSDNPANSLLASLATFGVGFLTRPIGAVVIGNMGDRIGRKPAMMLSFTLMGVGIVGLAATPSYAAIGVAAPVLVIIFRMIQGFALGGEVGPTTAFLVEAAPPHRRGFYAALQYTSQDFSGLIAGIVATILASLLSDQQLQDWGWRVAMLLGVTIIPFGLAMRRRLPETLFTHGAAEPEEPLQGRAPLRPYLRLVILGFVMLIAGTIGGYAVNYMTTYALDTLAMPAADAFGLLILTSLCAIVFELLSGLLSDRFGRRPVMIVPGIVLLLSIIPAFAFIDAQRTALSLYLAMAWLSSLLALSATPVVVTLTESLPRSIRSGTVATVYALAISVFGGTTGFTIKGLLEITGDPLAPAYYWTAAAALGLVAMWLVHESRTARAA